MSTIFDYLKWRGDLTFSERPLNEVDNLILSEIIYFEFSDVMDKGQDTTIYKANAKYPAVKDPHPYATNDPLPLLKAAAGTDRFKNVLVRDFVDIIDTQREIQFAAATFILPDDTIFVAFRGTDNHIVGWREDFNQSFLNESPAQSEAVKYLNAVLSKTSGKLMVGGHSKGGNLSVYASAFCDAPERISKIYSNDGPGFNDYIANNIKYKAILPKVLLTIPESSIVGILFSNKHEKQIVKSTESFGGKQHSPYTWLIERDHFDLADSQSYSSQQLDEVLTKWMSNMDDDEKANFVGTIFDLLDAPGSITLAGLQEKGISSYAAIFKAIAELNSDSKDSFIDSLKKLKQASRESFFEEAKKRIEEMKPQLIASSEETQ